MKKVREEITKSLVDAIKAGTARGQDRGAELKLLRTSQAVSIQASIC